MNNRFLEKLFSRNNEMGLSLPKEKTIYGVAVKRQPIEGYAKAIKSLETLPEEMLKACFPDMTPEQIIKKVGNIDIAVLLEIITRAFGIMPEQTVKFIAELINVPFEKLWSDPAIGLNGLKEILKEFWKLNDMTDFCNDLGRMVKKSKAAKTILNSLSPYIGNADSVKKNL